MQFRRLDDDVIVTVSGDEAVASFGTAKTKAEIIHAIRAHFAALPDRQDEQA